MPRRRRADTIFERLLRNVAVGLWKPGQKLPPTRQLEKTFRTSRMTMLAALHQAAGHGLLDVAPRRPTVVRPGAAEEASHLLAKLAQRREVRRVALLYPEGLPRWRKAPFFPQLIAAVSRAAAEADMEVEVVRWPLLEQVRFAVELAGKGFGAAFAVAVRAEYLASLHTLRQQRFPVVLFNASLPALPLPSVSMDEYAGARALARRLTDLGHRNLCLVTLAFDRRLKQRSHRTYGWLDYLIEADLEQGCAMPVHYLTSEDDAVAGVRRVLGLPDPPTALAFAYGALCDRFLNTYAESGLRIGSDLSVATFDPVSSLGGASWGPPITSITVDMDRVARCAVEIIEKLLAGESDVRSIRVPMRLNQTESIAAPSR